MDNKQKEVLTRLIQEASSGNNEYIWVDQIIRDSGYLKVEGLAGQGRGIFCTRKDLAAGFGVTERMVDKWAKLKMPIFSKGGVDGRPDVLDVFAVCKWYVDYKVGELQKKLENDQTKKEYWDTELQKAKAQKENRKNLIAGGDLLFSSEVSSQLLEIARVMRAKAELVEKQFGREVGDELREMVDDAVDGWRKIVDEQMAQREAILGDDKTVDRTTDTDTQIS